MFTFTILKPTYSRAVGIKVTVPLCRALSLCGRIESQHRRIVPVEASRAARAARSLVLDDHGRVGGGALVERHAEHRRARRLARQLARLLLVAACNARAVRVMAVFVLWQ